MLSARYCAAPATRLLTPNSPQLFFQVMTVRQMACRIELAAAIFADLLVKRGAQLLLFGDKAMQKFYIGSDLSL
jgi:hypothetical protein